MFFFWFLCQCAAFAGSIDSVAIGTEAVAGTDYLKITGGYSTDQTSIIIKVDIVCTTDATKNESDLAAQLLPGKTYKRLSNKAASVNTYEVTVTLYENGVKAGSKKKKVTLSKGIGNIWVITEEL